jgi:hypothetical protein
MTAVSAALIKTSVITETSGSLIYRFWGVLFFLFGISLRFREDFDFLLMMGDTRRNFFWATLGVNLFFSAAVGVFIVVERSVVDYLNDLYNYHNVVDFIHFMAPYATENLFHQFFFFFAFGTAVSQFCLMTGSFSYRFGKIFTALFWTALPVMVFIVFPGLLWMRGNLTETMKSLLFFLYTFSPVPASLILLFAAAVFSAAAFLNIRKLPQRAG